MFKAEIEGKPKVNIAIRISPSPPSSSYTTTESPRPARFVILVFRFLCRKYFVKFSLRLIRLLFGCSCSLLNETCTISNHFAYVTSFNLNKFVFFDMENFKHFVFEMSFEHFSMEFLV